MKTLVNDPFEDDEFKEEPKKKISFEPHTIVYGTNGRFTDALDESTIQLLAEVGVIYFVRAIDHGAGETRIYTSRQGKVPDLRI